MKSLMREPLIHFLCIGAALFLLFELFDDPAVPQSSLIVIKDGQIEFLKANYARLWQRPPTEKELQGLIDGYVREEIFYRKALALGLDKNDTVIRRRLKQKLELMSDDIAGIVIPTDDQLQQFLETNSERFKTEQQIAFRHVYIDITQRGISADDEAEQILALLLDEGKSIDPDTLGDRLMHPRSFRLTPVSEIAKQFGKPFSRALKNIAPGKWTGPIQSGYGLHLILVQDRVAEKSPQLDEIRKTIEWEWSAAHKKELKENIYKELRQRYTIVFEQKTGDTNNLQTISTAQAAQGSQQ